MKRSVIFLTLIVLLGAFLYFYKINTVPSGIYVDEATIAYNANSILQTGKDEYGYPMPFLIRLLGSHSPSLYVYLVVPMVKVFGMTPFAVRALSAVATLVSIIFFYLLALEMKIFKRKYSYLVATFFFAICPWIIFNSRVGYGTTVGFSMLTAGSYFLYKSIKNPRYLSHAVFLYSLSTYTSHNQKFLVPVFLVAFLLVYRKIFFARKNRKYFIRFFIIGFVSQIPNFILLLAPAFWVKTGQFSFKYIWNYLLYLSPKTIFWKNPDIDLQHTMPEISLLFDWMVVPYLAGLFLLFKNIKRSNFKFLAIYFFVSLVPSVFSGYFLSSQRSLSFAVPLLIVVGVGIDRMSAVVNKNFRYIVFVLIALYSLIVVCKSYYVLFPKERAQAWNYGYDQVSSFIKEHPGEQIVFDSSRNPRAYILLLYHMNVPPQTYQKEVDSYYRENYYSAPPPSDDYKFLNVEIHSLNWQTDLKPNTIIIGDNLSVSEDQAKEHNLSKLKDFYDEDGNIIFEAFGTN